MFRKVWSWRIKLYSFSWEEWGVVLFGFSFFAGIWYAFPMVNNVSDVWGLGGGVLRALEAHSLMPLSLAYGTVSFYQNYLLMIIALGVSFVFSGFDLMAVKTVFILNPHYSLLVPRIASVLTAMALLCFVYRFLMTEVKDKWWRLAILLLLFGNVITIFLTRSGKMWMLSITLATISFLCLYRSITEERRTGMPGKYALWSIITAGVATANFFFAGLFFVALPILWFTFPKTRVVFKKLVYLTGLGFTVFFFIFLLNAHDVIIQVSRFLPTSFGSAIEHISSPSPGQLSLYEAFRVKIRHVAEAFPFFLIALAFVVWGGVRNRTLATLAAFYGLLYLVALGFTFRADHDLALNVRHVFPLAIFLTFFLAACNPPRKFISMGLFAGGALCYLYTVLLLSVPTTYNDLSTYITKTYGDQEVHIEERIFELTLPMNKASFALLTDQACASTCQYRRSLEADITFLPIVVIDESDPLLLGETVPDVVITERSVPNCIPVARFGNPVPDTEVFDIDINLGRMLLPSFYKLHQLGKNLYVYETASCPAAATAIPETRVRWF